MFSKLKNLLSEIQLLLTLGREYGKLFEKKPIITFRRAKSLKDILMRAKVAPPEKEVMLLQIMWRLCIILLSNGGFKESIQLLGREGLF